MKHTLFALLLLACPHFLFAQPKSASCTQNTSNFCCGFGILNVSLNTINNTTSNASDGYKDYSGTIKTDLLAGAAYSFSVDVSGASGGKHNVKAWIDFNDNGTLDSINELVFSQASTTIATGTITIPGTAVLNKELRMRVSADYDLAADFGPCKSLERGQAEDYSIKILSNPNPPSISFEADKTTSCDGTIGFTDKSANVPTSWLWNFGDGQTSNQQNPQHTYASSGMYTVKLTATNTNGTNTDSLVNYINVTLGQGPKKASCTPQTLAYCCDHGITKVNLGSINNVTPDATEGYQDYSCTLNASLAGGTTSHQITVETGTINSHDVKAWIDFNNDSTFSANEEILSSTNQKIHTATFSAAGATLNIPLRLRVIADFVGNSITPCSSPHKGQAEDYSVNFFIQPGWGEENNLTDFSLYPNPASDKLNVEHRFSEPFSLSIVNLVGKLVYINNYDLKETIVIDSAPFPRGLYYIVLSNSKTKISKRVVLH